MINNKYLIKWIKENYPMMDFNDVDLSELNYYDFDKFANWIQEIFYTTTELKTSDNNRLI